MENNKLFVGGLAWETDDDGLTAAFKEYGNIEEAKVIRERDSGRSRGFGFVTFDSAENAAKAMEAMNGQEVDGRQLRVDYANSR